MSAGIHSEQAILARASATELYYHLRSSYTCTAPEPEDLAGGGQGLVLLILTASPQPHVSARTSPAPLLLDFTVAKKSGTNPVGLFRKPC